TRDPPPADTFREPASPVSPPPSVRGDMTNRGTTRRTDLTGAAALGAAATLPPALAPPAHAASGPATAEDAAAP
ncbi:hypothetical protein GA0115261_116661, partial [Streptomyces sp. OspMP-M43]